MVQCSNSRCAHGWFHLGCANPPLQDVPDDEEDWYCSETCKQNPGYIYCHCQKHKGDDDNNIVQCQLGAGCLRYERYYLSCLGKAENDLPDL